VKQNKAIVMVKKIKKSGKHLRRTVFSAPTTLQIYRFGLLQHAGVEKDPELLKKVNCPHGFSLVSGRKFSQKFFYRSFTVLIYVEEYSPSH
jgi:hypothetical protein